MKKVYLIAAALLTSSSLQQTAWGVPLTPDELNRLRTYASAANTMRINVHGYDPNISQSTTDLKTLFPKIYPQTQLPADPKSTLLAAVGTNQQLRTMIEERWNINLNNGFAASQQDLWSMAIAANQANGWDISLLASGAIPTNRHLSAFYNNAFISLMESINRKLLQNKEITESLAPLPNVPLNPAEDANDPVLQNALRESQQLADAQQQANEALAQALSTTAAATASRAPAPRTLATTDKQGTRPQTKTKQQEAEEERQRAQELTEFKHFLKEEGVATPLTNELHALLNNRRTADFHKTWNNLSQRYEADFRRLPTYRGATMLALSQDFQITFWNHAIKVISQQPSLNWHDANTFRSWYRLRNYITNLRFNNSEGIHALDPLIHRVLPQILRCPINQENMDQPGDSQTATRISHRFMEWINQSGLGDTVIANAIENVVEKFLRPKGANGINFQESDPNRIHWQQSTFVHKERTYTTYNSYKRRGTPARDADEAYYPSLRLRLEWQAGFLVQAEALIRFVDSLPSEDLKNKLKRNLVFAFSEAIEADGLCLVGNWTRWFEAILKLGYEYIQLDGAVTGTEEVDLTWLTQMPRHETPQSTQPETLTTTTNDIRYKEFKYLVELYYPDHDEIPFDSQKSGIMGYWKVFGDCTAQELLSHKYPMNRLNLPPLHLDNNKDAWSENGLDMGSDNDEDEDSDEGTGSILPSTREEIFQGIGTFFQGEGTYSHLTNIDAILASNPGIKSYLDAYLPIFPNATPAELLSDQKFKDRCNNVLLHASANSQTSSLRKPESSASRPETRTRAPARSSPTQILDVSTLRAPLIKALRRTPSTGLVHPKKLQYEKPQR